MKDHENLKMLYFEPLCDHNFLSWKCCLLFAPAAYIQVHFRLDFFMEANNAIPDQTAPKVAVWSGLYCLQYRLPKNIRR